MGDAIRTASLYNLNDHDATARPPSPEASSGMFVRRSAHHEGTGSPTMFRILYATDGSEGALHAGYFLGGLSHRRDAHVHIVMVLDRDDPDEREGASKDILEAARVALGDFPGHVTTATARAGGSTSEIVEALLFTAAYIEADLIALGASGRSALNRFFLGSVSETIARHANCPVLLARGLDMPLHEVVFGVDGSDRARQAICWTTMLPLPPDYAMRLVRVVTPPAWVAYPDILAMEAGGELLERVTRKEAQRAREYLAALKSDLTRADTASGEHSPVVETEEPVGDPADQLIRIAHEQNASLIVVGSKGLTGIERFLLGSVSEKVARHAPCSVLVYHQSPTAAEPQEGE